jgi:hypothetical protein
MSFVIGWRIKPKYYSASILDPVKKELSESDARFSHHGMNIGMFT